MTDDCVGTTLPVKGKMKVDAEPPHRPVVGHLIWCTEHDQPVELCKIYVEDQSETDTDPWRLLLKRYMDHVGQTEGVYFVDRGFSDVDFTDEEKERLESMIEEIQRERD